MNAHRPASLFFLAGALLALACSRSSRSSPPAPATPPEPSPPSLTVSCAPESVSAGGAGATCTATLQDAVGDVTWTLSGPGALSASTGAAIQYLPPSLLDAGAVAHVVATAAGLSTPVDIGVAPSPVTGTTVAGRVVDAEGNPVEGVGVEISAASSAITGADGAFTLSGVTPPYDLVLLPPGEARSVTVYAGLTRTDPTVAVYPPASSGAVERGATVTGTVTGGEDATSAGGRYQGLMLATRQAPAVDPPSAWGGRLGPLPCSGTWSVSWRGPESLAATALGVQWRVDPGTGVPVAFWLAWSDVGLADATAAEVPPLTLAAVPATTIHGVVRLPTGSVVRRISAQLAPGPGAPIFPLFYEEPGSPGESLPAGFGYVLPAPEGATLRLCARTESTREGHADDVAMACVDATGLSSVEIAVPAAPVPIAPANGANAVSADTVFAWRPFEEGVHALEVVPDGPDAPAFLVFTAQAHAVLPVLGRDELALPSGAAYSWRVRGFAPVASVDDLAASGVTPLALDHPAPPGARWTWGRTGAFRFQAR